MQALDALFGVILKVAEAMKSPRPQTLHFTDRDFLSLKHALNKPGEPKYNTEKVQLDLAQIHMFRSRSVWLFC